MHFTRRQLAEGIAAATLLSAIRRGFGEREARAAGPTAKNLILLTSGDGSAPEEWSFTSFLGPLAPFKDQMAVIRGMRFADDGRNFNHNGAEVALRGNGTGLFGGASVDHYIAKAKATADLNGNAYGLVVPMTNDAPGTTQSRVSYDFSGKIASFPHTPMAGFRKFFPDTKVVAEQGGFLELAMDELQSLRPRLGTKERAKIDSSLESLSRIKKGPTATTSCTDRKPTSTIDNISSSQLAEVAKAHIDLAVMALQCGLTKVITLQFGEDQSFTPSFMNVPGVMSGESQHGASHANNGAYFAMQKWYSTQCAYLLTQLADKKLLQETLVVRTFDFGRGDHQGQKLSFVPCFFAGAGIKGAQELDVRSTSSSHNAFLATICAAVGAPVPTSASPLAAVLA